MGANAQTTVPTFTSGQVLTADQMNQSARTGVPVFVGTAERDAAFGGSGEKTLAEGQLAYIESTKTVQFYNGTTWLPLNSGLNIVTPETALSAAATLTLDGCFTSNYTNYRLIINATAAATSNPVLQLRAAGVTAATNYNRQQIDASSTTLSGARVTSQTSFELGYLEADYRNSFIIDIMQPQIAQFTNFYIANNYSSGTSTTNVVWLGVTGFHAAATAYDGFIITFNSNTTGTYALYGYGK